MKNRGGFTIVETLITLSVSSVLFVAMMLMFNGRQGKVEFSQGLKDIESHIQDIANDVRNGYYPSSNKTCTSSTPDSISFSDTPAGQGLSSSCVFLGKAIVFTGTTSPGTISAYSVAGLRSATTIATAKPILIGTSGDETKEEYRIPAGIKLVKDNIGTALDASIGLFFDYDTSLSGGSAGVLAYKISASDFNTLKSNIINISENTSLIDSTNGIKLCFDSGTSSQKGAITIKKGLNGIFTESVISDTASGCWGGLL